MDARSVVVRLRAEVAEYVRRMKEASKATREVGDAAQDTTQRGKRGFGDLLTWVDKNSQQMSTLTSRIGLVGIALVAMAAAAVTSFANFDYAMSAVAATGDDARTNIVALRDAALDAGQRTAYSATEAAGAIEELSKAGLTATQILDGGLDGALDLAAAGATDVAEAAGFTAVALNQFHLDGSKAAHVADLLAAGAGKAMGDVTDLGMALKQGGLVASQMGMSIEETTGVLAAFAQAGLIGSDAGTSLRTMLLHLANPTDEARGKMDALGIAAYDAQGNFVGMESLAGQLSTKLRGLTQAQRDQSLAMIFGQDAIRGANVLYNAGATEIAGWTDAVDDTGYAAEAAATRMNNLKGDVEQLQGALETAMIQAGEGANGPLRALTQSATDAVNAFSALPEPIQQGMLLLTGGTGLVALGVAGLGKLVISVAEVKAALAALKITAGQAGIAVGAVGGVLAVATLGVMAWSNAQAEATARTDELAQSLDQVTGSITTNTRAVVASQLAAKTGWWVFESESVYDSAAKIGVGIDTITDAALSNTDAMEQVKAAIEAGRDAIQTGEWDTYAQSIGQAGLSAADWAGATMSLERRLAEQGVALTDATRQTQQKADADDSASTSTDGAAASAEAYAATVEEATRALDEWLKMVATADAAFVDLQGAYDLAITKNQELAESTAAATESSTDSWEDYYDGISVSSSDYIAQLQAQVEAQQSWETNMVTIATRVNEGMTGEMRTAARGMIDELLALGPEGAAQVQLLATLTDEELAQVVTLWANKGEAAVTGFNDEMAGLVNPTVNLNVSTTAAYETITSFINDMNGRKIYLNTAGQQVGFQTKDGRNGFDQGGYTGDGAPLAPAGVVHRGEFVFDAPTTAQHRPAFEYIHRTGRLPGYDKGGYVNGRATAGASLRGYATGGAVGGAMGGAGVVSATDLAAAMSGLSLSLTIAGTGVREVARVEAASVVGAQGRSQAGTRSTVGRTY